MVRQQLRIVAGALALAAAAAWWPADDDGGVAVAPAASTTATPMPGMPEALRSVAAADVTSLQAALIAAAARVCADGCEEAQVAPLPADLDAWSLAPEPTAAITEQTGARQGAPSPLFNTPPAPDDHDPTPADESDPYAPPAEEPAVE
jgi:hypothetical protein